MSDGFNIDFDSKELISKLSELGKNVEFEIKKSLMQAGEQLREDSTQIVPFRRGFNGGLAGSASTQIENDTSVIVGYNMPYAAKLHEDMTLNISQKFASPGFTRQQKYLEKPAKENAEKYGKIFSDGLSSLLNG